MSSTLVELVQQGDPGTAASDEQAAKLKLLDYQELYELWERQHWLTQDLDFSRDIEDWQAQNQEWRDEVLWGFSLFFAGEQRVTAELAPIAYSAPTCEMQCFLATQLVDEARHHIFFDNYYREVVGLDSESMNGRLDAISEHLTAGFTTLFDDRLHSAIDDLRADPENMEAMVRAVTTYHMIVEGTLALTGQHFFTQYLEGEGLLPGFLKGFALVSRDEHRHVAFGTRFLRDMAEQDSRYAKVVQDTLADLIPIAAQVIVPKSATDPYNWEVFGYTSQEVNEFAFKALSRRLKAMRIPLPVAA